MKTLCIPPSIDLARHTLNIAYRVAAYTLTNYILSVKQQSLWSRHKQTNISYLAHFLSKLWKRPFSFTAFDAPPVRFNIIRYEKYIKFSTFSFLQRLIPYKIVAFFIFFLTCISPSRSPLIRDTLKGFLLSLTGDVRLEWPTDTLDGE